ncbi:hypothetical protein [Lactobacillus kefiranofaciens]|uniref:Uncharacterized protein n=1 Tax=Lactobacillus kefiranofaciens TaxID=267818 RepID=A0AAX3UCX7_9LACO|nr:hypothetical protein [Lactobacillus kefiranofaciens]AEG41007.1 Hypothetical protein WANG_1312 [Lactobacillus kefiranofaciens subsp. kefiranofaciens]KRL29166.1 hypothetical protein FC94_GL000114 [Lactobacillus kefiranofaciens subsp. kefirgranum DSM 10550 = JCM 8572]KRM20791.1 hypothetical protein FC93_GL001193 [Lactobacillus kefiranofaciens subsp. kefiranofaciens DSM 5016 = JCM 6985]MCJ2173059.1 hypothetical protein [Lactobacillus kefiranofaciens]MCP9331719.1 hypothetical protein [Lactobacil
MKINLKDLNEKIENQDYIQDLETVKYAAISKSKNKIKPYAEKMVKEAAAAFKHNSLVQTQLTVTGQRPATFALETNIINLPYSNYKKIANFFEEGQEYPLNVYFETRSDFVNVSGFRIDQLATEEELEKDPDAVVTKLIEAIIEKLTTIREYQKPEKTKAETKKTAAKKKTTSKKKTTKKTAKK